MGNRAGCVALRRFSGEICEMKRLYVKPTHRAEAIGKQLALAVIQEEKTIGYYCMRLVRYPPCLRLWLSIRGLGSRA